MRLGQIDHDGHNSTNEHSALRVPENNRHRFLRNQMVRVVGPECEFLARIITGPFYPSNGEQGILLGEVELLGEMQGDRLGDTNRRPPPGSPVHDLSNEVISSLYGCTGELRLGGLVGHQDIPVALRAHDKGVLPRNVGIFGTVGSGKTNTSQVMIEEAARAGWAVVVIDVEGEYVEMDSPATEAADLLANFGVQPSGVEDFSVFYPTSCASDRKDAEPFTLRISDFENAVIAELIDASMPERNALFECIDHFITRSRTKVAVNEREILGAQLDASPETRLPFNLFNLREKAVERGSRSSEHLDFVGLAAKLSRLMHSGAFDEPKIRGIDVERIVKPGRVSIIDVSAAEDAVQALVTAAVLRKTFAYKLIRQDTPPTLLVIEEAHSFISRERVQSMQATLQMLRTVTRRGRKRWLSVAFISQQPGHLPAEIFELCNTRVVHNLRSLHNLEALMSTAGDVSKGLWDHCPLLGPGEALLSSPQLRRPLLVQVRPASSRRRFTH
jgi:DNA helicase HerA-like ATPase